MIDLGDLDLLKVVKAKDQLKTLLDNLRRLSQAKKTGGYKDLALEIEETVHTYDTIMADIKDNYLD